MIPPQVALILWIVISIGLFAVLSPLRAFLLTYLIGYLVLPCEVGSATGYIGSIYITQSLRIDKLTACNIGAVVGSVIFAPHVFSRFRFHWVDAAFGFIVLGMFLTSLSNGLGAKDGMSHSIELVRQLLPIIILSRLYLRTADDLYQAARAVVAAGFLYAFICVAECRLSPFLHTKIYGYFQHSFDQFARYGFFRPIGFLRHAIEVSFFMGSTTALGAWLWYRKLFRPLWGVVPAWLVVLATAVGTVCTLTFSGNGELLLGVAVLAAMAMLRSRWVLAVLPVLAILWMAGRYTSQVDASLMLRAANALDKSRADSLTYRLESEEAHLVASQQNLQVLMLGKGAINGVDLEDSSKAVDAWWLIMIVFYGLVGIIGWYLVWGAGIIDTWRRWRRLTPDLQTLSAAIAVLLGLQFIDFLFNSFPSPILLILDMGLVSTLQCYRPAAAWQQEFWVPAAVDPEIFEAPLPDADGAMT